MQARTPVMEALGSEVGQSTCRDIWRRLLQKVIPAIKTARTREEAQQVLICLSEEADRAYEGLWARVKLVLQEGLARGELARGKQYQRTKRACQLQLRDSRTPIRAAVAGVAYYRVIPFSVVTAALEQFAHLVTWDM